jgi:hypothetical protein
MPQPSHVKDVARAILESQEPLPPYELDRRCNLTLRLRVGEVIERAVSKPSLGNGDTARIVRRM